MAFRFDKLTHKAQEAVAAAQALAADKGNPEFDPLHVLAALLDETDGIAVPLFEKIGVSLKQLRSLVTAELARFPSVSGGSTPQPNANLRKCSMLLPRKQRK